MKLKEIRNRISEIDSEIIRLLNERMENSLRTSRYKKKIEDPEREKQILEKLKSLKPSLIDENLIETLYKDIFNYSCNLQKENRRLIGLQKTNYGSDKGTKNLFNETIFPIYCKNLKEIFEAVDTGALDYGLVPLTPAAQSEGVKFLIDMDLYIVGEIKPKSGNSGGCNQFTDHFYIIAKALERGIPEGDRCLISLIGFKGSIALEKSYDIFVSKGIDFTLAGSYKYKKDGGKSAVLIKFQGSIKDKIVEESLQEIQSQEVPYKFLGCYKEGRYVETKG